MAENEEANSQIYNWLCCVSKGESRASKASRTLTTIINTLVEVWGYYHGFCVGVIERKEKEWCYLVIVDKLTKLSLFLSMKMTNSIEKLAKLYVNKLMWLHGVPIFIMSN